MPARPARARWLHPHRKSNCGDSSGQPEGSAALAACSAAGGHLVDSDGTSRRDRALHGPAPLHQLRSEHNFNVEGCGKFWPRAPPRKATARTATRMTARPSCTARGPTGNGVPAAERRWGSFKLVTGQAWRGHLSDRKTTGTQRRGTLSSMTSSGEEGTSGTEMRRGRLSLARGQHGARRGPNARDGSGPYNLGDRAPMLSRPTHASSPGAD